MITELDIYKHFRSIQSSRIGKGYRVPKDWVKYFTEKLSLNQQKNLTRISKYFSTVWSDIDIDKYMECGFELFPKFSYHMFFNEKVMKLYIVRDKLIKNDMMKIKKDLINSSKFVNTYMKDMEYNNLFNDYCKIIISNRHVIVTHYLTNKISSSFLCWMIAENNFSIYNGDYEMVLPFIIKNYRDIYSKLKKNIKFLNVIKEKLN